MLKLIVVHTFFPASLAGVDVVIHSEGFGDPGKTGINGVSTITVNGQDYSLHKRGFNFVVLDAFTGKG